MTRAEFEATREFSRCTAKQKVWLQTFIANGGEAVQATVAAFNCTDVRHAQIYSYAVLRSLKIRAALNLYLGKSEREIETQKEQTSRAKLLRKVRQNLREAEPGSIAAQRLLAQEERLVFGGKSEAEDEPQTASKPEPESRVPAGMAAWYDKDTGVVIGYRTPDGKDVQLY